MINEHLEELAALHALGLLDAAGEAELQSAAARDPDVRSLVDSLVETAAALAHDAPLFAPPPELKRDLMRQLPRRQTAGGAKVLSFPVLIPYALAAGLAGLAIWQHGLIQDLDTKLRTSLAEAGQLRQSNSLIAMRIAELEAKDASYSSAKVMVAWDPAMHRGVVSMQDMPAPPPGHDYQLWVLDPKEPAPVSAGVLKMEPGTHAFSVHPVETPGPGFAISLEPAGGMPEPTGAILFAVAPSG